MEKCDKCKLEKSGIKKVKWCKNKLFITTFVITSILILSYYIPFFNPLFNAFFDYLKLMWWALLLGFIVGGMIDYFVPKKYIYKFLGKRKKKTIFFAVIFGFFMAACSHGILAISMELYKKGASIASVISFLLASPWANLPITILLISFFGIKALFIICAALIIALITGFIYYELEKRGFFGERKELKVKKIMTRKNKINLINSLKGILAGSWNLVLMVLWWILIGIFLASLARAFIPKHFFHNYLGAGILGLLVTLAIATIIEICSEGSSPMAFEIYRQVGSLGNPFIFLMAGVATDYTEIGLIWHNIGKKAAVLLPLITIPQILLIGYLFNVLL